MVVASFHLLIVIPVTDAPTCCSTAVCRLWRKWVTRSFRSSSKKLLFMSCCWSQEPLWSMPVGRSAPSQQDPRGKSVSLLCNFYPIRVPKTYFMPLLTKSAVILLLNVLWFLGHLMQSTYSQEKHINKRMVSWVLDFMLWNLFRSLRLCLFIYLFIY